MFINIYRLVTFGSPWEPEVNDFLRRVDYSCSCIYSLIYLCGQFLQDQYRGHYEAYFVLASKQICLGCIVTSCIIGLSETTSCLMTLFFSLFRVQGGLLLIRQGRRWHHHDERAGHRHEVTGSEPNRGRVARHDKRGGRRWQVCVEIQSGKPAMLNHFNTEKFTFLTFSFVYYESLQWNLVRPLVECFCLLLLFFLLSPIP